MRRSESRSPSSARWFPRSSKPKFTYEHADFNEELFEKIVAATMDEAKAAMDTDNKNVRRPAGMCSSTAGMSSSWRYPDMDQYLEEITYKFRRRSSRPGCWRPPCGRPCKNEIRPLAAEVGVLPQVHGSGLFTRGQTRCSASPR